MNKQKKQSRKKMVYVIGIDFARFELLDDEIEITPYLENANELWCFSKNVSENTLAQNCILNYCKSYNIAVKYKNFDIATVRTKNNVMQDKPDISRNTEKTKEFSMEL